MKFIEYTVMIFVVVLTACSATQNHQIEKVQNTSNFNTCILTEKNHSNYSANKKVLTAIEVADAEFESAIDHPCKYFYRRVISEDKDYFKVLYLPESQDPSLDIVGGDVEIYIDKKSLKFVKAIAGQ